MKILSKFKINITTYIFFLICFLCGYIKNILIIFTICFIHELGHLFFIKLFAYDIVKVEFFPFGGYTTINNKINSNINKELLIACGGFISQLLLILILYLFRNNLNIITYNLFISYSIILILFNILPIIPLDGNKIFHLLLEKFFSYHLAYYLNLYISLIILVIFIFINYIYKIDNYFIITFLIYEVFVYYKNYLYLEKRFLLERYLDDFEYHKIDNNTKSIRDLRKNVLHYFKENNHYIKEKDKIRDKLFDK